MEIETLHQCPTNSNIAKDFGKIDYCDSFRIANSADYTAEQFAGKLFELPKWADILMKIRDFAVGIFGIKTEKDAPKNRESFFSVIEKTDDEVVMGMEDKHLNFRVSIFIDRANSHTCTTTIVHYNNRFGAVYFTVIKPFHKIIVKSMIKKIRI